MTAPEIAIAPHATREEIDTQLDLEKMLGAAVVEQARYFREIHTALLHTALKAFVAGRREVHPLSGEHAIHNAHVERVARLLAATRLLGRVRVLKEIGLPLETGRTDFAEVLKQVGVDEAVAYLASLPVATRDEWYRLIQGSSRAAFTAAGVENTAALEALKRMVAQALTENWNRPEFEQAAEELLRKFESEAGSLRTLWNTTTSSALAKGREDIARDPDVQKVNPFWLYGAMMDFRVRPNHAALNGAIAPIAWEKWWGPRGLRPPNGYNCRCTMVLLTTPRAKRLIAQGSPYFDATKGIEYGGPDLGFIKFAEAGKRICCEPDADWEKAA